ncbi:MAG: hypothetical protein NC407_04235 [Lachnoclostridium sp.]|nr:hypothetical protein [Lachnoclostridium sp.]
MDKYEYKVRADEIKALIAEGEYAEAVKIADTIDWRRVRSVMMLCTVSDLYKINRRFQESKEILLLAYEKHPTGRLIVYSLCELSIKMEEYVQAIEYYKEFVQIAPKDTGQYILLYRLYEAQDVSLEERIAVLEDFKKRDYREKWAYELAYLYHRIGLATKCIEECDEMFLWFGEGKYVIKALELKALHVPLNAQQQEKYDAWVRARDLGIEEEDEEESEEEEDSGDSGDSKESEDSADSRDSQQDGQDILSMPTTELPEVKTVDVGQYNTLNLQMALAESMKEILTEENGVSEESGTPDENRMAEETEEPSIAEKIIAPLLENTSELAEETLSQDVKEIPENDGQPRFTLMQPEAELAIQQEPELIMQSQPEPELMLRPLEPEPAMQQPPKPEPVLHPLEPELMTQQPQPEPMLRPLEPEPVVPPQPKQEPVLRPLEPEPQRVQPAMNAAAYTSSNPYDNVLSQEYDGQIRLVMPDVKKVEKQITGQLSIEDIMAEWEEMKKSNEQKRMEDVRRRILSQTGGLFADFDEATKSGLLEQLEKAFLAVIMQEPEKDSAIRDVVLPEAEKAARAVRAAKAAQTGAGAAQGTQNPSMMAKEQEYKADTESANQESADGKVRGQQGYTRTVRELTDEEQELFGQYVHHKKSREQLIHTLDNMSMAACTGNVLISGEEASRTLALAKELVREMQHNDGNFSGKIAKISGAGLNKKDVATTLKRLSNGALVIEGGSNLNTDTVTRLCKTLEADNVGLLLILEDTKQNIDKLLAENPVLKNNFNLRVDIEALDDEALVAYAKEYAEEQEYSIDEFGVLALHTRIADMQTSDHEVSVAEVRELVDEAIYYANKKTPKHFVDILLAKRYDDEDMIILRENDFMHY